MSKKLQVTILTIVHILAVIMFSNDCLDTFYINSCSQSLLGAMLLTPWYPLMEIAAFQNGLINSILFVLNSVLWGYALSSAWIYFRNRREQVTE